MAKLAVGFWLYVPISLAAIVATPQFMPSSPRQRRSVGLPGAATVTAGLALAVLAVVRAPQVGRGVRVDVAGPRRGRAATCRVRGNPGDPAPPPVRLGIFRTPPLGSANLAQVLRGAAWVPMWYFLNLYLQQVLGYGAFASGAVLLR